MTAKAVNFQSMPHWNDPAEGIYVVDPLDAAHWLDVAHYEHQRPIRQWHVSSLAKEMSAGRFRDKTRVSFCRLGDRYMLINGQHTLTAIKNSGVACLLSVVVHDVQDMEQVANLYAQEDTHLTRRFADSLVAHTDLIPLENPQPSALFAPGGQQADVDRVESIRARAAVFGLVTIPTADSATLARQIADISAVDVDESFEELREAAQASKKACLYRLIVARDAALHREAEAARIAAEADAARAKAQAEREERIAREAAERATREAQERAERERKAAALAAELERVVESQRLAAERHRVAKAEQAQATAERRVQAHVEQVARDWQAVIESERERANLAAREADAAHRDRIHAEIAADLGMLSIPGIPSLVESIAAGRIRHLRIIY